MLRRFRGRSAWMVSTLVVMLITDPVADAAGGRGGHHGGGGGGGHRSAPRPQAHASANRMAAPRAAHASHSSAASRGMASVPHQAAVAHNNNIHSNGATRSNSAVAHQNTNSALNSSSRSGATTGTMSLAARAATIHTPTTYAYGSGNNSRNYRASGYGRGYSNRYYGNSRNYGRSQSNDRSLVARLRSVHSTLVRLDHDYQGHRARAAQNIALAIRHLSHRSNYSYGNGTNGGSNLMTAGLNGNRNLNGTNGNGLRNQNGNGLGNGQRVHLTQAQSDSRMSQALRTTQGISMQLSQQSQNYTTHRLAQSRLHRAIGEMNTALTVR